MNIVDVTIDNLKEETLFCVKDMATPGAVCKTNWFNERYDEGLRLKIMKDEAEKPMAFIEYIPADLAWRPVNAPNFMFIHCIYTYSNKTKGQGLGSALVKACEDDARARGMAGVCNMTSNGAWVTTKELFAKNGFEQVDARGRFELMAKQWDDSADNPSLYNWQAQQQNYQGWHLVYADQCPWHEKAVRVLEATSQEFGIELNVHKLASAAEAKSAPSGFGVFSLLKDGRLIEDHYISETRFRNILNKELS